MIVAYIMITLLAGVSIGLTVYCVMLSNRTVELANSQKKIIEAFQECFNEMVDNHNKIGEAVMKHEKAIDFITKEITNG